jgi:acetyl esterase/lipase
MALAGPFDASLVEGLRVEIDKPSTTPVACRDLDCTVPHDVLAPTEGRDLPTFVLVPGGPVSFTERRYMEQLAAALARRGSVVFLSTYRGEATGSSSADSDIDVRCAVRVARAETADYGGDASNVVLVGHSFGSQLAIEIATTSDAETPDCLADGDGVPEAVVGLAGFYVPAPPSAGDDAPPLWLGGAEIDGYSVPGPALAAQLDEAGFTVEYQNFPDARHDDMVDPATPGLLDLIFEAATRP